MTTKEKKYVFILTFNVNFGKYGRSIAEVPIWSDKSELYYADIQDAKNVAKNSAEDGTGLKANGVVLMNCTRTLNEEYENENK